jgi:putative FmdB family regulatory protein
MPTYDFECEPCAYITEIRQSASEPNILKCPICEQETLKKVFISAPTVFVRGEPTTIGQLAERNTSKIGKYELETKRESDKIQTAVSEEVKKKRKEHRAIQSMTPEQQVKYIKTGEMP